MRPTCTFDLGTKLGWASGDLDSGAITGTGIAHFNKKTNESSFMRYVRYQKWLRDLLDEEKPSLIVYEATQVRHQGERAAEMAYKLEIVLELECHRRGINYTSVSPSTLKKFSVGNGRAKKEQMVEAAEEKWPKIKIRSHDQADALWLLFWAATSGEV